jgi:hypothetical protein
MKVQRRMLFLLSWHRHYTLTAELHTLKSAFAAIVERLQSDVVLIMKQLRND